MASNPKKNEPDGEVVYRRFATGEQARAKRESRLDPALVPLIVGFAVLLLVILLLGNLSVGRIEETSRGALQLEQSYAARASMLLRFREALTRVDNEARNRMEADARHELRPPFDLRLDTARNRVNDLVPLIDKPPLSELPKWHKLRGDVSNYLELTRDRTRYSQEGFSGFREVDSDLTDLITESGNDEDRIFRSAEAMQLAATRSIRRWNIAALLIGLVVAVGTIWEVQRRFRQTKQSTEDARREREFSNQMLEGMVSAIAAIDRQDRIRSANTAFFRIFPHAAVGSSIHDRVGSPQAVKLLEAATASHVETATYRGRWNLNEDAAAGTFDIYSSPLEIDGERGQILTLVDVTEATKSEAALRRSESLAAVGSAAAQLAHEIKNPLGSIRLGVEMLRQYTDSEEAEKTITLVERGIQHLNKLVVDVTQFSRTRQLEVSETDLHEVIDSSIDLVADRVREKETPIEKRFAATKIEGVWDSEQLREVFVNLLANAIDASEPKSPVEIATELITSSTSPRKFDTITANGDRALITVSDQGSGMSEKAQARLFEPFFTTKKRGTGLGLSIVRQIIDLHGGSIAVESEKGKGTTFRIELPIITNNLGNNATGS